MEKKKEKLGQERAFPIGSHYGMSRRFYAACAAMQGLLTGYSESLKVNGGYIANTDHEDIIKQSYELADELLIQESL